MADNIFEMDRAKKTIDFNVLVAMDYVEGMEPFRVAGSGAAVNGFTTCLGDLTTGWSEQAAASVIKISSGSEDDNGVASYGTITQVTGASKATGNITFTVNPDPDDTITMYGQAFTFKASGATTNQINIGEDLAETLANAVVVLNASVVTNVAKATYTADATKIYVVFDTYGTAGNSYTIVASVATPTAATLENGANGVGSIAFTKNLYVGDILTINGTDFTIVASGASGNEIDIDTTLSATLDKIVTALNASSVAGVALATYSKTGTNTTLTATYDASTLDGSAYTLAATSLGSSGARTVLVSGVDANYNKITETVTLNGQTAVNTVNTFRFVEELKVLTAGTGLANAGIIYAGTGDITTGVPDTKYCSMAVGINLSRQAFAVVPAGYKFVLTDFDGQNAVKETASSSMIYRKAFGGLWERRLSAQLPYGSFATKIKYEAYPEKTLIRLVGYSAATTHSLSSALQGYLVKY